MPAGGSCLLVLLLFSQRMQYYHLKNNIYISVFNQKPILLDTLRDRYIFIHENEFKILNYIIDNNISTLKKDSEVLNKLETFIHEGILNPDPQNEKFPFFPFDTVESSGIFNLMWDPDKHYIQNENKTNIFLIFKTYLALFRIYTILHCKGLDSLINCIKKQKGTNCCTMVEEDKIQNLVASLNQACKMFPWRIRCLEWSSTLVFLLLKKNVKANLVIGVQTNPFLAHAWVEYNGVVINDDSSLKESLARILIEPYKERLYK